MTGNTIVWVLILGLLDTAAVVLISRYGTRHTGEHTPHKPEESHAVAELRKLNAERLAKIEAARAKALPSGEAQTS